MKRFLLLVLLMIPALVYSQTDTLVLAPTDTITKTKKHLRTLGFHGNADLNYNYATPGEIGEYHGIGADAVFGYRFAQWYLLGGGVGFHSLLYSAQKDYNLAATFYFQNTLYIPTRGQVYPMIDLAIGGDFGFLGIGQSYYTTTVGLYGRIGAGIETKYVNLCLGYEYVVVGAFYARIGYNF